MQVDGTPLSLASFVQEAEQLVSEKGNVLEIMDKLANLRLHIIWMLGDLLKSDKQALTEQEIDLNRIFNIGKGSTDSEFPLKFRKLVFDIADACLLCLQMFVSEASVEMISESRLLLLNCISQIISYFLEASKISTFFQNRVVTSLSLGVEAIHKTIAVFSNEESQNKLWIDTHRDWVSLKFSCLESVHSTSDSLRTSAVAFLKALVILYSSEKISELPGSASSVRVEGEELLLTLCSCLRNNSFSGANLVAALNAISAIAVSRPHFMTSCIKALLALSRHRRPPAHLSTPAQWGRVLHALRSALGMLSQVSGAKAWQDAIQNALRSLGSSYRSFRMISEPIASESNISGVKRSAPEAEDIKQDERQWVATHVDFETQTLIHSISPSVAADLVFQAFGKFEVPEVVQFDNRIKELKRTNQQQQLLAARRKNPFEGVSVMEKMTPVVERTLNDILMRSIPDPRLRNKTREATRVVMDQFNNLLTSALQSERREAAKKLRLSVVPPISTPQFSYDTRCRISDIAFERILSNEMDNFSKSSGRFSLRKAMICKILVVMLKDKEQKFDHQIVEKRKFQILDYIMADVENRLDVAIHLLYNIYTDQIDKSDWDSIASYDEISLIMMQNLLGHGVKRFIEEFISLTPAFTYSMLEYVKQLCMTSGEEATDGVTNYQEMAFHILKYVISIRPWERMYALQELFTFSSLGVEEIQSKAIAIIVDELYPLPYLSDAIEEYAKSKLPYLEVSNSLDSESEQDSVQRIHEYMRKELRLLYALSQKNIALFNDVILAYSKSGNNIRRVFHEQVISEKLTKALDIRSPVFIEMVRTVPDGAEFFLLQLLIPLSANVVIPSEMVSAIEGLFKKTQNPLFLIPVISDVKKDLLVQLLPRFISLRDDHVKLFVHRLVNGANPSLPINEFLVRLHLLAPNANSDKKVLDQVKKTVQLCLNEKAVQNDQILGSFLQKLIGMNPIPILFMNTLIKILRIYKSFAPYAMNLLSQLVKNKVWEDPQMWTGFVKVCQDNQPQSYNVILLLPRKPFARFLEASSDIAAPLQKWIDSQGISLRREYRHALERAFK